MYRKIQFPEYSTEILEQIKKGAFLTVKANDEVNTMTISWGSIGFMWNKPVFTVMVRHSRHTYKLMEKANCFTVSMPLHGKLKQELSICGTQSGKDINKFDQCNLTLKDGNEVDCPIIDNCDLHIECDVVYKSAMNSDNVEPTIIENYYPSDNYHVIYYGVIKDSYIDSNE